MTVIWVNVDKPTGIHKIHRDSGCWYVHRMAETPYKGIGILKKDGGWLSFATIDDVQKAYPTSDLCRAHGCW